MRVWENNPAPFNQLDVGHKVNCVWFVLGVTQLLSTDCEAFRGSTSKAQDEFWCDGGCEWHTGERVGTRGLMMVC